MEILAKFVITFEHKLWASLRCVRGSKYCIDYYLLENDCIVVDTVTYHVNRLRVAALSLHVRDNIVIIIL